MLPNRTAAPRHVRHRVFCLLSVFVFTILFWNCHLNAVEISVFSNIDGNEVPVANALVNLNGQIQYSNEAGLVKIDLKSDQNGNLSITHPGYLKYVGNLTGDGNAKASQRVELNPIVSFEWKGQILDAYSKTPVIGAIIQLEANDPLINRVGHYFCTSEWDGSFCILGLSAGRYHMTVKQPAFVSIDRMIDVKESDPPLNLELKAAVVRTGNLQIKVSDSVSGKVISGAKIRLEEGFEVAMVSSATTNGNGAAEFRDIKIGLHNRDKDGKVEVTVPNLLVNISADGYHTSEFAVEVGGNYAFQLDPEQTIPEKEENNTLVTAQKIPTSVDVEHSITPVGDQDLFRFELLNNAFVTISGNGPIERYYTLMNADGQIIWTQGVPANAESVYKNGLPRGVYFIKVEEWGNNAASDQPFLLKIRSNATADGLEPNDTFESARLAQPGNAIHGIIFPVGDKDCYRFHLSQPGLLRFQIDQHAIETYAVLYRVDGETKTVVANQGCPAGAPMTLWGQVQITGDYVLCIEEWGNNGFSEIPYRATLEFVPNEGFDDPERTPEALPFARQWKLNEAIGANILPIGDHDTYRLDLPTPGMLYVETWAPVETYVDIRNADGGIIFNQGAPAGSKIAHFLPVDKPKSVYLSIEEWGNNGTSAGPYTIRNFWYPSENREQGIRNDTESDASPILCDTHFQGNLFPVGDKDFYQYMIPFPGQLTIKGQCPIENYTVIKNARKEIIFQQGHPAGDFQIEISLLPGLHFFEIEEWGNNSWNLQPYTLDFNFRRAEPNEIAAVASDPPRQLLLKQAQSFKIDLIGDKDTFLYESPGNEDLVIYIQNPIELYLQIFDDQTGKLLFNRGMPAGKTEFPLKPEQPTRYRLVLEEWGNNNRSDDTAYIMIAPPGVAILPQNIEIDPGNSEEKTAYFKHEVIPDAPVAAKVEVDVTGDGKADFTIPQGKEVSYRFAETGAHLITVTSTSADGVTTSSQMWVDIPQEKIDQGLALTVTQPTDGQMLQAAFDIEANVVNFSQSRTQQLEFSIDGKWSNTDFSEPYSWSPPWQELSGENHVLKVIAKDNRGKSTTVERSFSISPFFDLQPANGTNLSGENVRVSWLGSKFGQAQVKIRKADSNDEWVTVTGDSGRYRSVVIPNLVPGTRYEFQASDGEATSSLRTFNLVKGLAFGKPSYGANIKRDYDQRLGISVRNNSDKPLAVELTCGKPENSNLLVGFVGDGSADKPFELKPGEEREFTLGMSAQDVVRENHEFPVRIISKEGLTDEAIVKVNVRLPQIKLEWLENGNTPLGLGKKYRLINRGDTVTDLAIIAAESDKLDIAPAIFHGMLPSGQSVDVTVSPKLFSGFKSVSCDLKATALDKEFVQTFKAEVPDGKELHQVLLIPGVDSPDSAEYLFQELNMEAAESLDPSKLDWSGSQPVADLSGDGNLDRWMMYTNDTEWTGDDTNGDGEIDFVHADIGQDGIFEYSALRSDDGSWSRTNLVEAWLEMGFSLPWSASSYHPHNVDILLNGQAIGQLRDTVPNGNYTFYIPPHLIKFNALGEPDDNHIGIHSEHLRGGHYVVNSDFRFNIRMTATPVWSVGEDRQAALEAALHTEGLVTGNPDFSVSSSDLVFSAPSEIKAGDPCGIESTLRNLGAVSPEFVDVILRDDCQGREPLEIQRVRLTDLKADEPQKVSFFWRATPGQHKLTIVADPDQSAGDLNRLNNEAIEMVTVPGDADQPTIAITRLEFSDPSKPWLVSASVRCDDSGGLQSLESCIDGGIWQTLPTPKPGADAPIQLLMQPGDHQLKCRVTDSGGNQVETEKSIIVPGKPPTFQLLYPKTDVEVQSRSTHVMVACPPGTLFTAVRIEGGPWYRGKITGTAARAYVPLTYGEQILEVMIVDRNGIAGFEIRKVTCTRQALEGEQEKIPPAEDGIVRIPGLGEVDYFSGLNHILK